jgi:hypothetical protein
MINQDKTGTRKLVSACCLRTDFLAQTGGQGLHRIHCRLPSSQCASRGAVSIAISIPMTESSRCGGSSPPRRYEIRQRRRARCRSSAPPSTRGREPAVGPAVSPGGLAVGYVPKISPNSNRVVQPTSNRAEPPNPNRVEPVWQGRRYPGGRWRSDTFPKYRGSRGVERTR